MKKISFISIALVVTIVLLLLQNQYSEPFDIKKTSAELKIEACSISGINFDDSVKAALDIRADLLDINPSLGIKQVVEEFSDKGIQDDTRQTMAKSVIYIALPWIIILALTLIFYFFDIFCFCECCPPCNACKFKKAEKVDELKLMVTLALIVSTITIGICIAGIVMASQMKDDLNSIRCATISLYSDVNDGTAYSSDLAVQKWKGLTGLNTQMTQIISQLDDMIKKTEDIIDQIKAEQLDKDYKKLLKTNEKLNTDITYSTGSSYYSSNQALLYIQNGTNNKQDAFVTSKLSIITPQTQLFQEIYDNIIKQITSVQTNGKSITDDQIKIRSALDEGKTQLTDWSTKFSTYTQDMFDSTKTLQDNSDKATTALSLIFGIVGLFVLFSLLAVLGIYISQSNMGCCKNILCCTCFCYLFGLIICLLICILLSIVNATLAESCQYFDDLTTVQANFQSSKLFSSNVELYDIFNECFFKDGDILNLFNVNATLTQIENLDSSISKFSDAQNLYSTAISKGKVNLNTNQQFIQDFFTFKRIDYVEGEDVTNIKYIMKERFKDCKLISVIENQSSCGTTSIYYDSSTEGTFPTATENLCLQSSVFSFQNSKLQSLLSGCSQTTSDLSQANNFYQQQSTAWRIPLQSEKDIITNHESNQKDLDGKLQAITDYSNQVSAYLKTITDKNTGLVGSANCKFAKTSVSNFTNTLCVREQIFVYIIYIFFGIISGGLFISHFYFMRIILGVRNIQRFGQIPENQNIAYQDPNQNQLKTNNYQNIKPQAFPALYPGQVQVQVQDDQNQQANPDYAPIPKQ